MLLCERRCCCALRTLRRTRWEEDVLQREMGDWMPFPGLCFRERGKECGAPRHYIEGAAGRRRNECSRGAFVVHTPMKKASVIDGQGSPLSTVGYRILRTFPPEEGVVLTFGQSAIPGGGGAVYVNFSGENVLGEGDRQKVKGQHAHSHPDVTWRCCVFGCLRCGGRAYQKASLAA